MPLIVGNDWRNIGTTPTTKNHSIRLGVKLICGCRRLRVGGALREQAAAKVFDDALSG